MVRSFVLRKREKQFHAQQLEKWSEPKLRELLKKLTDAKPEKLQHSIGTISTLRGTYRRWCCMDISHDKDVDYAPLTQDYIKWLRDLLQWGEEVGSTIYLCILVLTKPRFSGIATNPP